jgi:hypothetical protein
MTALFAPLAAPKISGELSIELNVTDSSVSAPSGPRHTVAILHRSLPSNGVGRMAPSICRPAGFRGGLRRIIGWDGNNPRSHYLGYRVPAEIISHGIAT